jgi:predicted Zn-ribbon and HTH transcriptional regulator
MKTSHECPKCDHREILFVPHVADRDDRDVVRPLVLYVRHHDWKDDEIGVIQAYVCRKCGYTELYTSKADTIPVEKIPGAKLLKSAS